MARTPSDGIVMVAYTYYPWDPRVRREAETLVRRGHTVTVLCCRDAEESRVATVAGVHVERLPLAIRRGGMARYLFQYAVFFALAGARLLRTQSEGVHVHSVPDILVFAGIGARMRGIPLTLDLHEAMPELVRARFPDSRFAPRLALVAEKLSCLFAHRIIVVNETIRDLLAGRGVAIGRVTVLFNSPDVPSGPVGPANVRPAPGRVRLVYAGSVDRERDLETLVRAVAQLREDLPTSLVIYGRGDSHYVSYLRGLVDGLGLQALVRFGGVLSPDQVLAHLAHADVGVVPYARNPLTEVALPNKVFEFVVLDKPLVLPDLKAMRHAFDAAAWFYEPGDARDLAAKIRLASVPGPEDASRRARMRMVYDAARWEKQADRLAALYAPDRAHATGGDACT